MTAVLDATPDAPATDSVPAEPPASWLARAGAFAVDVLLGVAVIATMALLALTAPQWGWLWWVFTVAAVLTILLMAVNRWLLPAMKGWSLGRALFGIAVVRRDGSGVGVLAADGAGSGASAGHRGAVRRMVVAAVGSSPPDLRRPVAAHRGAAGRAAAARHAAADRGGAGGGCAGLRRRSRARISGGVPAGSGARPSP